MDTFEALIVLNSQKSFHPTPTDMLLDTSSRKRNLLQLSHAMRTFLEAEQGASVDRIVSTGIDMYKIMVKILEFYKAPKHE